MINVVKNVFLIKLFFPILYHCSNLISQRRWMGAKSAHCCFASFACESVNQCQKSNNAVALLLKTFYMGLWVCRLYFSIVCLTTAKHQISCLRDVKILPLTTWTFVLCFTLLYFFMSTLYFPGSGLSLILKSSPRPGSGASEALLQVPGWEGAGACYLSLHPRCAGHVGQGWRLVCRPLPSHPASTAYSNCWLQFLPEAGSPTIDPHLCSDFCREWDNFCHRR